MFIIRVVSNLTFFFFFFYLGFYEHSMILPHLQDQCYTADRLDWTHSIAQGYPPYLSPPGPSAGVGQFLVGS